MLGAIADWSSVLGLLVSIVGFFVTIIGVRRSRSAAEQAREAADSARDELLRGNAMFSLATAINTMEEIKRLQREAAWRALPDRYSALRSALISIRAGTPQMSPEDRGTLQGAIEQFRAIEKKIEKTLSPNGQTTLDVPKLNDIVSLQIEKISELLGTLRVSNNGR